MPKKITCPILFTSVEVSPLIKRGGLGDVIGSLPKSLKNYIDNVAVLAPFNENINYKFIKYIKKVGTIKVFFGNEYSVVTILKTYLPKSTVPLFLFKDNKYLGEGEVYTSKHVWNPLTKHWATEKDSKQLRFLFFSQTVYEFIKTQYSGKIIIHANDWHTAPLILLTKGDTKTAANFKTLFTIHNGQHVGQIQYKFLRLLQNLPKKLIKKPSNEEKYLSLLSLGVEHADLINTVSPQYATELLSKTHRHGFENILEKRRAAFSGILNGIDMDFFNPTTDSYISYRFSESKLQNKLKNKRLIQQICDFEVNDNLPLFGFVHRFADQKGLQLIIDLAPRLEKMAAQFIFTGTGDKILERELKKISKKYSNIYYHDKFDIAFSQKIFASSDIFLMPSKFEPCGLSQIIAMRYGAVPIVHNVGGLKDTIHDGKNGFTFNQFSSEALWDAIQRAITTYYTQPKVWRKLITEDMTTDYSWNKSAQEYLKLYRKLITTS